MNLTDVSFRHAQTAWFGAFESNDGGWCAVELITPVQFRWQMPP